LEEDVNQYDSDTHGAPGPWRAPKLVMLTAVSDSQQGTAQNFTESTIITKPGGIVSRGAISP
jgi:hypothetical protein